MLDLPIVGDQTFRKDTNVGTEGVTEGFSDDTQSLVLLKMVINDPKAFVKRFCMGVNPRDLQLSMGLPELEGPLC